MDLKSKNNNSSLKATIKDRSGLGGQRIGELLKKQGHISAKQFDTAVAYRKKHGGFLSSIIMKLGFIESETLVNFLVRQLSYIPLQLDSEIPTIEALNLMPYDMAKKYMCLPLRLKDKELKIAMLEPTDNTLVEALQTEVKRELSIFIASELDLVNAYQRHYGISEEEYNALVGVEACDDDDSFCNIEDFGALASEVAESFEIEAVSNETDEANKYKASDAPIVKLVNGILIKAIKDGISDIHIEPYESNLQVRYRLDGALYMSMNLPVEIKNALVSRIKILAELDITERRQPQDGRIRIVFRRNQAVDFRVSVLPTLFGERIVLRILDKSSLNTDLTVLGFEPGTYKKMQSCITRPQGLILVTGPTGSGKTVTLYSMLNAIKREETNIMTAEDPVEFNFKGINQVNVNNAVGMTFAAALKAFLRQDPDVIMVGEIRDMETAEIAIKAAMTGHLVLSTLHTNDCVATINRLVDIGVPPFMVSSAVTMVLAQRLGRRLCKHCKTSYKPTDHDSLLASGFDPEELAELKIFKPKGCPKCNGFGYKGRVGFFELMEITKECAKAINARVDEDQLRKIAIKEGMKTLRMAALQKCREGITSLDEVQKRTVITEESLPAFLVNPDVEEYQDGEFIIREGNTDNDFFKLVRGAVDVIKNGKKIFSITEADEIFGEMAAICSIARPASVVANGPTVVKRYAGDKIFEMFEANPSLFVRLFKTIANRLNFANQLIVESVVAKEKKVLKDPYFIQAWAQVSSLSPRNRLSTHQQYLDALAKEKIV